MIVRCVLYTNLKELIMKMVTKTVTYYDNISHRVISVVVTVPVID